jgi:ribosomal protein S18 acetylase RimI-like enzyme
MSLHAAPCRGSNPPQDGWQALNRLLLAEEEGVDMRIREAALADADDIVSLIRELARIEGMPSPITADYVTAYLGAPGVCILLLEAAGQVLGLISYFIRPNLYHAADCCLIDELIVLEQARGQGVGSALLEKVIERAIAMGCAEVSLSTMTDNAAAIAFYRQHGFTSEALSLEQHLTK